MASVSNDPNGRKRILFVDPLGDRKAIRVGKLSKKDADSIKYRVEGLLSAKITGAMDRDLSLWVSELSPVLREKLERVDLLEPIEPLEPEPTTTLDAFLTDFMEGDVYFKIRREGHNRDRCRTQLKLVERIEEQQEAMESFVRKVQKGVK